MFRRKKEEQYEHALNEIVNHHNGKDSRKFYQQINSCRKEFNPRIIACKDRPKELWNLYETCLTTTSPTRVIAPKGKKQVAHIPSHERGKLVTFVGIANVARGIFPPVFVFPKIRNRVEYLGDKYSSSVIAFGNKGGRMTSEIFPGIIKHFVSHVKSTKQNRVLRLVDNHESHISVEVIRLCRENGIVLLSFPPHTTHRLQPLDVGVYSPFKTYLAAAR
ncbi:uncharacterized protein [Diabrotica undecimpunctata]|uniref:uncharacterized protein n=1 Tax=Diabrotica undecimpunctata TaxID=50387 RepID=UPI003B634E1C